MWERTSTLIHTVVWERRRGWLLTVYLLRSSLTHFCSRASGDIAPAPTANAVMPNSGPILPYTPVTCCTSSVLVNSNVTDGKARLLILEKYRFWKKIVIAKQTVRQEELSYLGFCNFIHHKEWILSLYSLSGLKEPKLPRSTQATRSGDEMTIPHRH